MEISTINRFCCFVNCKIIKSQKIKCIDLLYILNIYHSRSRYLKKYIKVEIEKNCYHLLILA